jgi:hypothetical protein
VKQRQSRAETGFESGLEAEHAAPAERLVALLGELRYYRRFFDEAHAILDDIA